MKQRIYSVICVFILFGYVAYESAYTVDMTEQVVVTQFKKLVGEPIKDPGIHFLIPFIQEPNYFPINLQEWDGSPGQIPTLEKKYISVDTFARWKISEPVLFFKSLTNTERAKGTLDDIIDAAVRNFITSHRLIEAVRNKEKSDLDKLDTNAQGVEKERLFGREKITLGILEQAKPKLKKYGIELVDVKIKRINYEQRVRESVYARMIAERKQISEKYRSEGRGEASKIIGEKDRDLKRIESEAYQEAQKIKGEADAEATRILANAHGVDPDFYSFIKSLEIYGESLQNKSTLVMSTDSEFLKYLKGYTGGE